jgi:hypothetical protein
MTRILRADGRASAGDQRARGQRGRNRWLHMGPRGAVHAFWVPLAATTAPGQPARSRGKEHVPNVKHMCLYIQRSESSLSSGAVRSAEACLTTIGTRSKPHWRVLKIEDFSPGKKPLCSLTGTGDDSPAL